MPTLPLSPQLTLHYRDENPSGRETVLLLHGLGANGDSWRLQTPALVEAGYRVVAPDLRGFGQAGYPGRTDVPQMAADTAALLVHLQTGPVVVAGISMGGTVALQLALDHPELTSRLVLVNTFCRLQPAKASAWFYFALRLVLVYTVGLPSQARAVTRRIFPHPDQELLRQGLYDQILQANPRAYRAAILALGRFDVQARLGEIGVPTLVVTGEADTTVQPRNQCDLLAIRGARQVVIPGAGHGVTADHPQEFNQVLLEFLRS
jgi:pimeloyl-ACP methyl ester carboxylesterase